MALKIIKTGFALSAVALLFFCIWLVQGIYTAPKTSPHEIIFEVEIGKGAKTIAQSLRKKEVLKQELPFLLTYELFFFPKSLKAGEYAFSLPLSAKDVLSTLSEGKVHLHPLTIPEGLTAKEISELLSSADFVRDENFLEAFSQTESLSSLDREAQNLEGYLFPETYFLPKGTPSGEIILTMVSQFKEAFKVEWQKRAQEIGLTVREVVILASLIEKETSIPEEKNLVSSVFHNRLRIGMKLDCDPTIIYVLKHEGRFKDRLRTKDLKYDTPYNTYLYPGLPPGPICNPGRESLEAALYPAEENYLYFVSKNDRSHQFSRTFKEHQRAVIKYQIRK
jgi:UPF0755 protein